MPFVLQKKLKYFLYIVILSLIVLSIIYYQKPQYHISKLEIQPHENIIKKQSIIHIDNFPVKEGSLSSRYGIRKDPFSGLYRMHSGIDIAAKKGTSIYPLGNGEVVFSGKKSGYGVAVEIHHGNTIITRYAHLKQTHVKKGQIVSKNDIIAEVGNSGRSTGPHLHLEITINGESIDPQIFLVDKLASK